MKAMVLDQPGQRLQLRRLPKLTGAAVLVPDQLVP